MKYKCTAVSGQHLAATQPTATSTIGYISRPSHASTTFAHSADGKPAVHRLSGQTVGVGVAAPCGGDGYAIPVCGLALPQYRLDDAWHGAVHAEDDKCAAAVQLHILERLSEICWVVRLSPSYPFFVLLFSL